MATRAERFRYERERAKPRRERAAERKESAPATTPGNRRTTRSSRAAFVRESSAGRPSRKSTRKAANRIKTNSNLTRRQKRRVRSPAATAAKSWRAG